MPQLENQCNEFFMNFNPFDESCPLLLDHLDISAFIFNSVSFGDPDCSFKATLWVVALQFSHYLYGFVFLMKHRNSGLSFFQPDDQQCRATSGGGTLQYYTLE